MAAMIDAERSSAENLMEVLRTRRSIRRYSEEPISDEEVTAILQAGMLHASGRNLHPLSFYVVRDHGLMEGMANARFNGTEALRRADCAIVVVGNESRSDLWVEDGCVALANMMLMAHALGIGACWIQGRNRFDSAGVPMEDTLRDLLGWDPSRRLVATLALGYPAESPAPRRLEDLDFTAVTYAAAEASDR